MLSRIVGRTFTLAEFMILTLIIASLAAGARPVYLGYVRSARMVEGQLIATSLWTALRAQATAASPRSLSSRLTTGPDSTSRAQRARSAGSLSMVTSTRSR